MQFVAIPVQKNRFSVGLNDGVTDFLGYTAVLIDVRCVRSPVQQPTLQMGCVGSASEKHLSVRLRDRFRRSYPGGDGIGTHELATVEEVVEEAVACVARQNRNLGAETFIERGHVLNEPRNQQLPAWGKIDAGSRVAHAGDARADALVFRFRGGPEHPETRVHRTVGVVTLQRPVRR